MFFELRQYTIRDGKMNEWVDFMEQVIMPFQVSHGMVILGSFRGEKDDSVYVWIRRFESEEEREQLYAAVYGSSEWREEIGPRVAELMDTSSINVQRIVATSKSGIH